MNRKASFFLVMTLGWVLIVLGLGMWLLGHVDEARNEGSTAGVHPEAQQVSVAAEPGVAGGGERPADRGGRPGHGLADLTDAPPSVVGPKASGALRSPAVAGPSVSGARRRTLQRTSRTGANPLVGVSRAGVTLPLSVTRSLPPAMPGAGLSAPDGAGGHKGKTEAPAGSTVRNPGDSTPRHGPSPLFAGGSGGRSLEPSLQPADTMVKGVAPEATESSALETRVDAGRPRPNGAETPTEITEEHPEYRDPVPLPLPDQGLSPGTVVLRTPSHPVAPGILVEMPLVALTGDERLAAYRVQVFHDRDILRLVEVRGGNSRFASPTHNARDGMTDLVAFQVEGLAGALELAVLVYEVIGEDGHSATFEGNVVELVNDDAAPQDLGRKAFKALGSLAVRLP